MTRGPMVTQNLQKVTLGDLGPSGSDTGSRGDPGPSEELKQRLYGSCRTFRSGKGSLRMK